MRKFLLDANVVIDSMRGNATVRAHMAATSPAACLLPSVVYFELWYGVTKSMRPDRNAQALARVLQDVEVVALNQDDATLAGLLRARLESFKSSIGPYDTLIAGQALARNLTLVTANEREFRRVEGLLVENWRHR